MRGATGGLARFNKLTPLVEIRSLSTGSGGSQHSSVAPSVRASDLHDSPVTEVALTPVGAPHMEDVLLDAQTPIGRQAGFAGRLPDVPDSPAPE
jgi:hypothetical protein